MQYIKAPFNFVPVSKEVFYPGWADQISHDVPFSDGLSGQLTVELKAETPIFIRDSEEITRFCHVKDKNGNDEYFIPGTSLKGTIRSVLEILSFAKMDKINDHKFAIRDLHNPDVYNLMTDSANIKCGWLNLSVDENGSENVIISNCGVPWRISHKHLDYNFKTNFVGTFGQGGTANFKDESNKTAHYKNDIWENSVDKNELDNLHFKLIQSKDNRILCNFSDKGGEGGDIVFTGQPGPSGKQYEFVFPKKKDSQQVFVDAKIWKEFKFHYLDHDPKHISADWKWRKGQLKNGEKIPVFFRINESNTKYVKDLGLAYLYKMPYAHSVKEFLPEEHRLGFFKPDLAESIFGYVNEQDALKGRVQFSTAWADMKTVQKGKRINTILGSPKASYYPIYIKQTGSNGSVDRTTKGRPIYKTFMDKGSVKEPAELSGRKRYPVVEQEVKNLPAGTADMGVEFTPLEKGAKFTATINYFNLRPVELGALLSALTFHNNASECYHGLGMAKPYGFGRVALSITDNGNLDKNIEYYLKAFESAVCAYLKVDKPDFQWHESAQVKEFIAMAKVQKFLDDNGQTNIQARRIYNERMKYLKLDPTQRINEFSDAKADKKIGKVVTETRGFYLEKYTDIVPNNPDIHSYFDEKLEAEIKPQALNASEQLKNEKIAFLEKERLKKVAFELEKEEKEKKNKQKEEDDRLKKLKEKEEAEQKRLNEILQKQLQIQVEIDKKQQEEQARIAERNNQLKAIGLDSLIKEISDFDRGKKQIESYMKRIGVSQLDINDTEALLKKATDWYFATPNKQRENRWKPTDGPDWKKIALYIGKELAQKWYNDLISKS